jgi:hypothetical protein
LISIVLVAKIIVRQRFSFANDNLSKFSFSPGLRQTLISTISKWLTIDISMNEDGAARTRRQRVLIVGHRRTAGGRQGVLFFPSHKISPY